MAGIRSAAADPGKSRAQPCARVPALRRIELRLRLTGNEPASIAAGPREPRESRQFAFRSAIEGTEAQRNRTPQVRVRVAEIAR